VTAGKSGLLRQLGLISATALVVSNMVGTGIFTGTGYLAKDLGSPNLILLIWVVGGICAFLGAICYSELGINFPSSGGEYVYLTRAFGPTWGFMTGWASFFAGFLGADRGRRTRIFRIPGALLPRPAAAKCAGGGWLRRLGPANRGSARSGM